MHKPAPESATQLGLAFLEKWRRLSPEHKREPARWRNYDWPETEASLHTLRRQTVRDLTPASPEDIHEAYETLAASYVVSKADEDSETLRAKAWLDTMATTPAKCLRAAVTAWMQRDTVFMPTPGQFYQFAIQATADMRTTLAQIDAILNAQAKPEQRYDSERDPELAQKLKLMAHLLHTGGSLREARAKGLL